MGAHARAGPGPAARPLVIFNERADALRRRLLRRWSFEAYLWWKLPLAACAGLSLRRLPERPAEQEGREQDCHQPTAEQK